MTPNTVATPSTKTVPWYATEDWCAVWIGGLVLAAIAWGYRPAMPALKWTDVGGLRQLFSASTLSAWLLLGVGLFLLSLPGVFLQRISVPRYALGFPVVFAVAWLAQVIAGQASAVKWGIEYVIFSLALGLLIGNLLPLPAWLREAARTEFYIKTGLVVMGATLLFEEIWRAGAYGMVQSVLVVAVVWTFSFWVARKFRLDDEFAAMLSSAVSICGVSAAIAACGAIQGDRKKLGYITSVVLILAVPMIILQPWIARAMALPDAVAGAWMGGTLDTTGSVVAAGALVSETAMKIGTIVKFSQNVLIGVAAFLMSIWWTMRKPQAAGERPSVKIIWERFPKFVLGFVAASLLFSFLLSPNLVKDTKSAIGGIRTMWFAMAFVSIGLETKFTDLLSLEGGRPFGAFLSAQTFNLIWTFLLAWLVFGGILVPPPAF